MYDQGHTSHVVPARAGAWIQINSQLVGVLKVLGAYRVRVQVDASQVDDPEELRRVAHDDLSRCPARRKAHLHRLDPVGVLRRCPLLEERIALRAIDVALEHDRPPGDPAQRPSGDRRIVPGQGELRVTGLRKEHLVRVGDHHLATRDFQGGLLRLPHENSVAELITCASPRSTQGEGGIKPETGFEPRV